MYEKEYHFIKNSTPHNRVGFQKKCLSICCIVFAAAVTEIFAFLQELSHSTLADTSNVLYDCMDSIDIYSLR
jgi:hypothetical protein